MYFICEKLAREGNLPKLFAKNTPDASKIPA